MRAFRQSAPIVGRHLEMEFLKTKIKEADNGISNTLVVGGEAGIGKTRLIEELVHLANGRGFLSCVGRCIVGPPLPLLPFIDVFSCFLKNPSFRKRVEYRDAASSSQPVGEGDLNQIIQFWLAGAPGTRQDKDALMLQTLDMLRRASRQGPILIVLEDIQWADGPSLYLLHSLARNLSGLKVLMVCTLRVEELSPGAGEVQNQTMETLKAMTD
jgi:hypothetical protein